MIFSRLCAGWTMKTSKRAQKDVFKRSLENFFASGGSADVLMKKRKLHRRSRDCIWPPTRKSSSPGATACPWRRSGINQNNCEKGCWAEDLNYKFYGMRRGQFYQRQAKGCRNGSRRTSRRCGRWASKLTYYSLLDYFVRGVSGLLVNANPHNKIEGLI